jgi:uncharacterized protein YceK
LPLAFLASYHLTSSSFFSLPTLLLPVSFLLTTCLLPVSFLFPSYRAPVKKLITCST